MGKRKYQQDAPRAFSLKPLKPQTFAQEQYQNSIKESMITFAHGAAGTGKTYIAAHEGLTKLMTGEISKILLTRPIVATEDLGFLPGAVEEKVHPYLLPLLDSIEAHVGPTKMKELFALGKIEIAPLAYMRGRTISNAFLIADEMQNCNKDQMKMLLTRIGYGTQMVINGDDSQSDLNTYNGDNGLTWAIKKLAGRTSEISVVEFKKTDIVRNPLIEKILTCLEGPDEVRRRESSVKIVAERPALVQ